MSQSKSIRYMLAPQMETYDKFGHEWKPYLMFMQKANFKSNGAKQVVDYIIKENKID